MRSKVFAGLMAASLFAPVAGHALPAGPASQTVLSEGKAVAPLPAEKPLDPLTGAIRSGLLGTDPLYGDKDRFGEALTAFYEDRDFEPVWIADGALSPAARATIARLKDASADGLDPTAYEVIERPLDTGPHPGAPDLAAEELSLSRAVMAFARDAQAGRIDPQRVSRLITLHPPRTRRSATPGAASRTWPTPAISPTGSSARWSTRWWRPCTRPTRSCRTATTP